MISAPRFLTLAAFLAFTAACDSGPHAAAGFRLPNNGDIERGKAAFVAKQCHTCHQVVGVDLPKPTAVPPVPVVLGGEIAKPMGDGYLVTSIINPSYRLGSHSRELTVVNGHSRMPHDEALTIRELTDIVAFLQSRYVVRMPQPKYPSI